MGSFSQSLLWLAAGFFLFSGIAFGQESGEPPKRVLTHADAGVMLAKYSGYFDRYVPESADLNECIAFLNKNGVYFGLMEVINGDEFTASDYARSAGQIDLLLKGEAEFSAGKVKLPKDLETWQDYCTMSDIDFVEGYRRMLEKLRIARARMQ